MNRGAFGMNIWNGFREIADGTSNTILASERCIADETGRRRMKQGVAYNGLPLAGYGKADLLRACTQFQGSGGSYDSAIPDANLSPYSGKRWSDGSIFYIGFNTILPPNGPACALSAVPGEIEWIDDTYFMPPSSYHSGGVNVALVDGSVRFVSENIDCTSDDGSGDIVVGNWLMVLGGAPVTLEYSGPSIFGIWGAMGSANGGESVQLP